MNCSGDDTTETVTCVGALTGAIADQDACA